jgi:hypothetical protein
VRATTLLNRLLDLPGVTVSGASLEAGSLVVDVRLRARRLACPLCDYRTSVVYDTRGFLTWWRGLDFGTHTVFVRAPLRRLQCPQHGVRVQAVPFARHRSGFTRDFEDVAAIASSTKRAKRARPCGKATRTRSLREARPLLRRSPHRRPQVHVLGQTLARVADLSCRRR